MSPSKPHSKNIIIAIDGYSSCGKSTLAKALAKHLGFVYVDTGAMYRAVALYCLRNDINIENEETVTTALRHIILSFQLNAKGDYVITLNGEDVSQAIRSMAVAETVSKVATLKEVRNAMVTQQQTLGQSINVIMDGRDIGTVVFPQADLKLFMTASPQVRAQRRYAELLAKGESVTLQAVFDNLAARDRQDTTRSESPLRKATDAILLNNSTLSETEQLKWVLDLIEKKNEEKEILQLDKTIEDIYKKHEIVRLSNDQTNCERINKVINSAQEHNLLQAGTDGEIRPTLILKEDILQCADEINLFTAFVLLYHPHLSTLRPISDDKPVVWPNCKMPDKYYYTFTNATFEKIYNFWEKIAAFIHLFFKDKQEQKKKKGKVYFTTLIDKIKGKYENDNKFTENEGYQWLVKFRDNEYKELNKRRKKTVHHQSYLVTQQTGPLEQNGENTGVIKELFLSERTEIPTYLKKHIGFTNEGLKHTLSFLEKVIEIAIEEETRAKSSPKNAH